ncbi:hypothetical protein [Paenibacillus massiliensis]|uniref:hypothetical protein n=1 Tax=Paenibacillus massiliensis TaxID=225917 RepID=UPI00035D6B91|nr:hypothetical protein [Paenibacillus massiliensis]
MRVEKETKKTLADQDEPVTVEELNGEIISEFVQQLSSYGQFIYNTRNEGVTLVVENLGYGDVYVSTNPEVKVGVEEQRLLMKEQKAFKVDRVFFTAASEPVVQILEIL